MKMPPDERVFREHVAGARFKNGVARRKWRLVGDISWPLAFIAISAAPRENGPREFFLRFDLKGYPGSPPTATPWNMEKDEILEENMRPKGDRVELTFRCNWKGGRALYAPFDRVALSAHPDWLEKYPYRAWNGNRDIASVLGFLHEELNEADYKGI